MFADIQAAIDVEKRMGRGKAATRDLLNRTCAEYNKLTTIKKHRIDGPRKALLYNLNLDVFQNLVFVCLSVFGCLLWMSSKYI